MMLCYHCHIVCVYFVDQCHPYILLKSFDITCIYHFFHPFYHLFFFHPYHLYSYHIIFIHLSSFSFLFKNLFTFTISDINFAVVSTLQAGRVLFGCWRLLWMLETAEKATTAFHGKYNNYTSLPTHSHTHTHMQQLVPYLIGFMAL